MSNHRLCEPCWRMMRPLRQPLRVADDTGPCCCCGHATTSGIRMRGHDDDYPRCEGHDD